MPGTLTRAAAAGLLALGLAWSVPAQAQGGPTQVDAAYAALGRALVASSQQNLPAARQGVTRAAKALAQTPNAFRKTQGYSQLSQRLSALEKMPALQPADIQAAMNLLGNVEARRAGRPTSSLGAAAGALGGVLGGPVRLLLLLLLGGVALVPLRLLNLAFGLGSRSWRAIQLGLLFLLLPFLLAGVGGLLALVSDAGDLAPGRSLLALNLTGGTLNQWTLWWLLSALGVGFLTYGAWGLCVQFGLLRNSRPSKVPKPARLSSNDPRSTSVTWDEEV